MNKYIANYFLSLNIIAEFYKKFQMKIVISGGPGTGKSSIIDELSKKGYKIFEESSREIIKKYKKLGHEQLFLSNPIKFSEILLKNRVNQYIESNNANSNYCFFDRGIPDILAYLDYKKILFNNKFKVSAEKYKYDKVFITEPWKKIYKKDQQRYESYEELLEIDKRIKETYKKLKYKYFIIPNTNVVERVNYIIDKIG